MTRNIQRNLLAAVAAAVLLATSAVVHAEGITRDQVRAELAEARALGMLDRPGEAGATEDVLLAREQYNETQTRVLIAKMELEQRQLAQAQAAQQDRALMPEQVAYVEAGKDGPVVVLITTAADGSVSVVEGPARQIVASVDFD